MVVFCSLILAQAIFVFDAKPVNLQFPREKYQVKIIDRPFVMIIPAGYYMSSFWTPMGAKATSKHLLINVSGLVTPMIIIFSSDKCN